MKIRGKVSGSLRLIVFDIDNTLYDDLDGYLQEGSRGEIEEISHLLGLPFEEVSRLLQSERYKMAEILKREVSLTETVYHLGVTPKQWCELRERVWKPEKWFSQDPKVFEAIHYLSNWYTIVFGTNSPIMIGKRILNLLGIENMAYSYQVFGPENLGISKPESKFFSDITKRLGVHADQCISIGDREFSDCTPALEAEYSCAILVEGKHDLIEAIKLLVTIQRQKGG